jgi:hypothetical protein
MSANLKTPCELGHRKLSTEVTNTITTQKLNNVAGVLKGKKQTQ